MENELRRVPKLLSVDLVVSDCVDLRLNGTLLDDELPLFPPNLIVLDGRVVCDGVNVLLGLFCTALLGRRPPKLDDVEGRVTVVRVLLWRLPKL